MLQRSPSYVLPIPSANVANWPWRDSLVRALRWLLPPRLAHAALRGYKLAFDAGFQALCTRAPRFTKRLVRAACSSRRRLR